MHEIMRYVDAVRNDRYDMRVNTEEEQRPLHDLINVCSNIEVTWMRLEGCTPIIRQSLAQANLRARTGAPVVAILRGKQVVAKPRSSTIFEEGDRINLSATGNRLNRSKNCFPRWSPRNQRRMGDLSR
jgi:monovalent cation:H+ antiporter-2, CPA2 family